MGETDPNLPSNFGYKQPYNRYSFTVLAAAGLY